MVEDGVSSLIRFQLCSYTTRAVRSNTASVDEMQSAIMATWYHCMSTDADPHHLKCPSGPNSWCFFQRAEAKNEQPGKHADSVATPLDRTVAKEILDLYLRLILLCCVVACKAKRRTVMKAFILLFGRSVPRYIFSVRLV